MHYSRSRNTLQCSNPISCARVIRLQPRPAPTRQDRLQTLADAIRDQQGNEWGSRLTVQGLEEQYERLLHSEEGE